MCFNPFIDHIFINDASQLMEAEQSQFQSQEELRMQIKTAGYIAGLQGKQVVLFIPEGLDPNAMKDICSLMAEGVWLCLDFRNKKTTGFTSESDLRNCEVT